ncbi:FAD/NAD(P)-binding protein [Streptomyces sp. NPDC049577]|uniref:FAD/NAD(P)-binding protein n=1 Tax=Streptomyces sp. NPDC049577 TaxID=3155153 RepID=UPI0034326A8C
MSRNVVIVGGGPTAVSVFLHLARVRGISSVCFVAPNPVGCAPAFGSDGPRLLCNTSVDVTSLRADGESGLLRYLAARGWPVHRDDFVPRYLVTQYARESFLRHRAAARRRGVRVTQVRGLARSVSGTPGAYRVVLEDGTAVGATDVVLCPGGTAPRLPEDLRAHAGHPRLLTSPYPTRRLRALPGDAKVLVLGTKLSAIDAALALCRAGRPTVMTSPSGQLPAVRTRLCRTASAGLERLWERELGRGAGPERLVRPLIRLVRALGGRQPVVRGLSDRTVAHERLRHEAELAEAGRVPWQDAVAEVIDALNRALSAREEPVRRRVLATHRVAMSRYISSIPLANARRLLAHLDAGLLTVAEARPRRIAPRPDGRGWDVVWSDGRAEEFGWIVCATGIEAPALTVTPGGELRVGAAPGPGEHAAPVTGDLRVLRGPGARPERLWVAGAAAGVRFPVVNYLRAAAQHARTIGRALAAQTPPAAGGPLAATAPPVRVLERSSS